MNDRAIGSQGGGSTTQDAGFEWRIKNTSTTASMTQFSVRYAGEQWRAHTVCPTARAASQSISLAYAISPPLLPNDTTPPANLHFTVLGPEFQFTAPNYGGQPRPTVYPQTASVVVAITASLNGVNSGHSVAPSPVTAASIHDRVHVFGCQWFTHGRR
jgi:hypothetical protein